MLFNSLNFALFLPITFAGYWFIFHKNIRVQNAFIWLASYIFYSFWDWRFAFLLLFSTVIDYFAAIQIETTASEQRKKMWFWVSIGINLGFLGFFKYYNFFVTSFIYAANYWGFQPNIWLLNIILPIGISFYTFHGLSYIIDVYNRRIQAERNYITYSVFVSFFPLLVAGPIERATHLLPQLKQARVFNYTQAVDGLKQILWGFFKKMVIADNCGIIVDNIFGQYHLLPGSTLLIGGFLFHIQVYCDFSGYSDIALGVARLFGIELLHNFKFPFFATSITDNWRRWHISLSSWLRDYVYIPLGGGHGGVALKIRNIYIVFAISGLWHGAKWSFLIWGLLNATFLIIEILLKTLLKTNDHTSTSSAKLYKPLSFLYKGGGMLLSFVAVAITRFYYRSDTLAQAHTMYAKIFSASLWSVPYGSGLRNTVFLTLLGGFFLVEWHGRNNNYAIATLFHRQNVLVRYCFYTFIIFAIFFFGVGEGIKFIYFQF